MSGTFWAMLQEESLTATLPREIMDTCTQPTERSRHIRHGGILYADRRRE